VPAPTSTSRFGDVGAHRGGGGWVIRCRLAVRKLLLISAASFGLWLLAAVFHAHPASASPVPGAGARPAAARSPTLAIPTPAAPTSQAENGSAAAATASDHSIKARPPAERVVGPGRLGPPPPTHQEPAAGGTAGGAAGSPSGAAAPSGGGQVNKSGFTSGAADGPVPGTTSTEDAAQPLDGGIAPSGAGKPSRQPTTTHTAAAGQSGEGLGPTDGDPASAQSGHPERANPSDSDPQPEGQNQAPRPVPVGQAGNGPSGNGPSGAVPAWNLSPRLSARPAHRAIRPQALPTIGASRRANEVNQIVPARTQFLSAAEPDSVSIPAPHPDASTGRHAANCRTPGPAPAADATAMPQPHWPAWRPVVPRQPPPPPDAPDAPDATAGTGGAAASGGHSPQTSNPGALTSVQLPTQPAFALGRIAAPVMATVTIAEDPPISPD
jgi:hypothetical protein